MHIGCIILFLLVFGVSIIAAVVSLVGRGIERLGATAIWLWDSSLNLFRSEKVQTINPFNGKSNFDDEPDQDDDISYVPTEERPKRYDSSDGQYVDFEEKKS